MLKRHVDAVHEGKKPHTCPKCNANFAAKGDLVRHTFYVHDGKKT